jgi:hypothetical protein
MCENGLNPKEMNPHVQGLYVKQSRGAMVEYFERPRYIMMIQRAFLFLPQVGQYIIFRLSDSERRRESRLDSACAFAIF